MIEWPLTRQYATIYQQIDGTSMAIAHRNIQRLCARSSTVAIDRHAARRFRSPVGPICIARHVAVRQPDLVMQRARSDSSRG